MVSEGVLWGELEVVSAERVAAVEAVTVMVAEAAATEVAVEVAVAARVKEGVGGEVAAMEAADRSEAVVEKVEKVDEEAVKEDMGEKRVEGGAVVEADLHSMYGRPIHKRPPSHSHSCR